MLECLCAPFETTEHLKEESNIQHIHLCAYPVLVPLSRRPNADDYAAKQLKLHLPALDAHEHAELNQGYMHTLELSFVIH